MQQRTKRQVRPSEGAVKLGVSLPTFWRLTKSDPAFPKAAKLSARCTVFDDGELDQYVDAKRAAA